MHDISQVELETKQDQVEIISEVDASFAMVWHIAIKELHVYLVFRDREMRLVPWFCLFRNCDGLCFWHYLVLLIFFALDYCFDWNLYIGKLWRISLNQIIYASEFILVN
jgi:hypothetical protein